MLTLFELRQALFSRLLFGRGRLGMQLLVPLIPLYAKQVLLLLVSDLSGFESVKVVDSTKAIV